MKARRVSVLTLFIGQLAVPALADEGIRLDRKGQQVTSSAQIAKRTYELFDRDDTGAIIVEGDDITVDFQGATLVGSTEDQEPDAFEGRGIIIRGRDVTIRNVNVRGYKVGIYAEDSPGIRLDNCDVSRNYRQRLKSTIEREDLSDWLWGHENDENQWLRYGAGIYLYRCPKAVVSNCRARNGQNGLCIVGSDEVRVVDNDFSFMSGWGLAMWRSSRCEVFNNKLDWCIRGYSHGVYSRGQDSTGILIYEQCNDNLFAYNSATHGGDGFFLYAGNETVQRTGKGGCQRNVLYCNDFSHAAANGIEATFSQGNIFVENILEQCDHGVWAGYSYDTMIERNYITNCNNGVSIEHGQRNLIAGNTITDSRLGVHLWWDNDEDLLATPFCEAHGSSLKKGTGSEREPSHGHENAARRGACPLFQPQEMRCPSEDNRVMSNSFYRVQRAIRLAEDVGTLICDNAFVACDKAVKLVGRSQEDAEAAVWMDAPGLKEVVILRPGMDAAWQPRDVLAEFPKLMTGGGSQSPFLPKDALRGREYIFIDEWGPYDFSDYRVFPAVLRGGAVRYFNVLGPTGRFHITKTRGPVTAEPTAGALPCRVRVAATGEGVQPFKIELMVGDKERKTGVKDLTVEGTLLSAQWNVSFYAWTADRDPRESEENWSTIVQQQPLETLPAQSLDFTWGGGAPGEKVPRDHFATVATTRLSLPAGKWRARTVSDDGVRVFINGKQVLTNWTWHGPTVDEALVDLPAGPHDIRVEHFEIDGYAQLQFTIEP
jgi:parallel beta-helix repeat protein